MELVTAITDVNGNAAFADVSEGSHTVRATKDTLTASKTFNVTEDATITLVLGQATDWKTIGIVAGAFALGGAVLYAVTRKK